MFCVKSATRRRHALIVRKQGVTNVLGVIVASRMIVQMQYAVTVKLIFMMKAYALMVGAGAVNHFSNLLLY